MKREQSFAVRSFKKFVKNRT